MSRSFRRASIHGHGGGSEKKDKRIYNRSLRAHTRRILKTAKDFDGLVLPEVRDVSNPWSMSKDGKSFSRWLDKYVRTLDVRTRVRDGHSRVVLAITPATLEVAAADERELSMRCTWAWRRASDPLAAAVRALELLRK